MKFACPNCDAKYTIADERVRNKILKIRCKSCNNIIEVREPKQKKKAVSSKAPPKARSPLEDRFADSFRKGAAGKAKPKGTPGLYLSVKRSAEVLQKEDTDFVHWFVAIDNSPFGPVSARKIHSHKQAGKVTDASLVWKEGMADWAPIRNCKELVGLLAKIELEDSLVRSEVDPAKEKKLGLFAEQETTDKSPLKGQEVGVIAKREDDQLAGETKPITAKPEAEIRAGGDPIAPAAEDQFFDKGMASDESSADRDSLLDQRISNLTPLRPKGPAQNRWVMMAAVGFFVVAMVTLMVAVLGGPDSDETRTSVETVEKIVERVVYRDAPVERIDDDSQEDTVREKARAGGGRHGSKSNTNRGRKPGRAGSGAGSGAGENAKSGTDAKTRALMAQMGLSTPGGAVPVGGQSKKQGSNQGAGGAGSLTANQVKKVVDRNKSRLKACYERALRQGQAPDNASIRVDFKLTVGTSGVVKNTRLTGAGSKIPSLNQCLNRSVSRWVFPTSSSTSPVEFPFVFTPK